MYRFADYGGTDSEAHWKGGFNLGGGIRFGFGGANVFVESRYHSVQLDEGDANFVPVILGVTFR